MINPCLSKLIASSFQIYFICIPNLHPLSNRSQSKNDRRDSPNIQRWFFKILQNSIGVLMVIQFHLSITSQFKRQIHRVSIIILISNRWSIVPINKWFRSLPVILTYIKKWGLNNRTFTIELLHICMFHLNITKNKYK